MTMAAQIGLMVVPQEFTRLCNTLLIAEHGDDFLAIDDDRADQGNHGYLKSEKRMLGMHCFKRLQNQSLDRAIQTKMVGDLGKAIALRDAGLWDVSAWTFLSNYPVPQGVATAVATLGGEHGIDASWRGPDHLANLMAKHPEVLQSFPGLEAAELSKKLDRVNEQLGALRLIQSRTKRNGWSSSGRVDGSTFSLPNSSGCGGT